MGMGATMGDKRVWEDVLALKLEGVAEHTNLSQLAEIEGLKGFCELHKYHAIEEYAEYLWLTCDYIKAYSSMPSVKMEQKEQRASLGEETFEGKMTALLDLYDDWELAVLDKLRMCKKQLTGCKKDISKLICDVREELDFIDKLYDHIEEHSGSEASIHKMDEWLHDTYKKKLAS